VLLAVVVPVVDEVVVEVTPPVVVAVVAVVVVADVSVIVPEGMAEVAVLSVVDIVPAAVSVPPVVVVALTPVSVAAVSVVAFSSFLQPTAKIATANRATRVTMRDFFIFNFSLNFQGLSEPDLGCRCRKKNDSLVSPGARITSFRKTSGAPMRAIPLFGVRNGGCYQGHAMRNNRIKCRVYSRNRRVMSSPHPRLAAPRTTQIVRSFDATDIHYDLYDAPSRGAVLVVPGFWRDRRHPSMVQLAQSVTALGYRTAIVDVRGHGDSGGTYGFNCNEHYDVAAVAHDLLARMPHIESLTLIGLSYGGAIAISTAARHSLPIASLLLISPVADFAMIAPKINPFTMHRHIAFSQALKRPRFDWRLRRGPKIRAVDDIADVHVPVAFVHVKNDWLIAHQHSIALYEQASEPKELHIIDVEGNYHADRIFSMAAERVAPIVRGFLARYTPL
jgi:pimeloyl-ACP methyl ester carboxylesterase